MLIEDAKILITDDSILARKQLKDMFSEYGDIVTVEEVMKMLQIGRVSVYQMLKTGEIRSLKVGKKYVIPKKSVIELFDFQ